VRALQILVWVILVVAVLLPLLRRGRVGRRATPAVKDELVKDPVCQTYVVRSRAVTAGRSGGPPYFCSVECARRYAAQARG
jgi:YHS domain-containing protein